MHPLFRLIQCKAPGRVHHIPTHGTQQVQRPVPLHSPKLRKVGQLFMCLQSLLREHTVGVQRFRTKYRRTGSDSRPSLLRLSRPGPLASECTTSMRPLDSRPWWQTVIKTPADPRDRSQPPGTDAEDRMVHAADCKGVLWCSPTQHMPPSCTIAQVLRDMQQAVRFEDILKPLPTKRAAPPCRGQASASDFTAARVKKKFQ
jgi:hypothetical protein